MIDLTTDKVPAGQQVISRHKWPIIGEQQPAASDAPFQLQITGRVKSPQSYSLADLRALPQTAIRMDIHCVTRWTRQSVEFGGVLLADLLSLTQPDQTAQFLSFVARSERNHSTSLPIETATQLSTLIALDVDGQPLTREHGGPIRNIVPERYFYKSVKWLEKIELLAEDRLGFWEAQTGYHNNADPWLEERYMSPTIDRRTAIRLIDSRDFSGFDLRSLDASKRELDGLKAVAALLRDANFRDSRLAGSDFTDANLSNAHFDRANLQSANFTRADVEGASFAGADLRGATFTDCSLIGASFTQTLDNGQRLEAIIDASTLLPQELLTPLTDDQIAFLETSLARPSRKR